jgi:hypothetical protein
MLLKIELLKRTKQRCDAINDTSRRRAAIAANRRAIGMSEL